MTMIRRALLAAGALLALFHFWLFAGQAWDGRLSDPVVLLRWLAAGALVAALVGLHRRGISIVRGRKAVAIWLLAVLLHGPAVARSIEGLGEPAFPGFVATLTQIAAASAAVGLSLALAWIRRRRAGVIARSIRIPVIRPSAGMPSTYGFVRFSPRPPPLRL
jgi:NADH:ubiquinone oxidoreductase subunit K